MVKLKNITPCEAIQVHNDKRQMFSPMCGPQFPILPCVSLICVQRLGRGKGPSGGGRGRGIRRAGSEEHRLYETGRKEYWRHKIQTEAGALERSEEGGLVKTKDVLKSHTENDYYIS